MAKVLYAATARDGKAVQGYVDATTAAEARAELERRGLRDVQLLEEVAIARGATDVEGLGEAELAAMARLKVRAMRSPTLGTVLAEVARRSRGWLLADALIIAFGLWSDSTGLVVAGLLGAAAPFMATVWSWRHAGRYQRVVRAHAVGQWDTMARLCAQLRSVSRRHPTMDFDLDVRLAHVQARSDLAGALAAIEPWRAKLTAQPGMFAARVAPLYLAAGDEAAYIERMAEALAANPGDPSRTMDLALAQARYGDADTAEQLLAGVDTTLLPPHAAGFVDWTRGAVQLRRHDPAAAATLAHAVAAFLKLAAQPAAWLPLAFAALDHALALHAAGRDDEARRGLAQVWPILRAHAPQRVLALLQRESLAPAA